MIEDLAAARRRDRPRGPVADQLWDFLTRQTPLLRPALGRVPRASPLWRGFAVLLTNP
ncbi:hypothetical protein [Streptomyces triticagri]|uniref:hypothetical protein n=1 Tax=Streptomyces triticagri TaxID=2293568 RepID=UPI0018F5AB22|nr:hypothetical protein [Streptomyces triticagri]